MTRTLHAAATFLLFLCITFFTFDWARILISSVSSTTYPTLNVLLWISYGVAMLLAGAAGPIIIASKDETTNIISLLKGYGFFWMAVIVVTVTHPIAVVINNAFMSAIADTWANQVYWFFVYFAYIFLLLIFPAALSLWPDFWLETKKAVGVGN